MKGSGVLWLTVRRRGSTQEEFQLETDYSLEDVQQEINAAIESKVTFSVVLATGGVLELDPKELDVISVSDGSLRGRRRT